MTVRAGVSEPACERSRTQTYAFKFSIPRKLLANSDNNKANCCCCWCCFTFYRRCSWLCWFTSIFARVLSLSLSPSLPLYLTCPGFFHLVYYLIFLYHIIGVVGMLANLAYTTIVCIWTHRTGFSISLNNHNNNSRVVLHVVHSGGKTAYTNIPKNMQQRARARTHTHHEQNFKILVSYGNFNTFSSRKYLSIERCKQPNK